MDGYKATVTNASKQLSKKEQVMLKDMTNALQLDALTEDNNEVTLLPLFWAEISVHNEHSDDKDYVKYVICADDGQKYVTGSKSFWTSFCDIMADMQDTQEQWELVIYKQPSKNYKGKGFLTCSIR